MAHSIADVAAAVTWAAHADPASVAVAAGEVAFAPIVPDAPGAVAAPTRSAGTPGAPVAVPPSIPADRVIDATNRGIDDLDVPRWIFFTMASCLTRTALQYPFNLAMLRKQAAPEGTSGGGDTSARGMLRELRRTRSVRPLFVGFGATAAGMVSSEVAYMWLYEYLRNRNNSSNPLVVVARRGAAEEGSEEVSQTFLDGTAGFIADATTTVYMVPFFAVTTRQACAGIGAAASMPYENAFVTLRRTLAEGGVRKMFAGLAPSLVISTNSFVWWVAYERSKQLAYSALRPHLLSLQEAAPFLPAPLTSEKDNVVLNAGAAVVAATTSSVLWNPFYVARTRMQMGTGDARMRDVLRSIVKTEGWRGLTRGTVMSVASGAVDAVAFSVLYEAGKLLAQRSAP